MHSREQIGPLRLSHCCSRTAE